MANVMTTQMEASLASGQVTRRQISPERTSSGNITNCSQTPSAMPHRTMPTTDRSTTRIVVPTSSVPIRNQGSPAFRRPGTENEKRPAMAPHRILDNGW